MFSHFNIFFQVCRNKDGTITIKLWDYGLAMEVKEKIFTVCGTPTYVAPEILAETGNPILWKFIGELSDFDCQIALISIYIN